MRKFVKIVIDSDTKKDVTFRVDFDMDDFKSITVQFNKRKEDCINLSLSQLSDLGYESAKALMRSVLSYQE